MHEAPPAVISHPAHPAHMLTLVTITTAAGDPLFRCDGCKELGSGTGRRYRCAAGDEGCDFDLHTCCALASPTLKNHPLLGDDLAFTLLPDGAPPAAGDAAACVACGGATEGLVYYHWSVDSKKKDLYLHPERPRRVHRVQLCAEAKLRCAVCGEKKEHGHHFFSPGRKLWAYRWCYGGEEGYLHVGCMKKIAVLSWEQDCDVDGGAAVMEASVPIMKGLLLRRREKESERFSNGIEIGNSIAEAVSAAATSS
ncbi:hypothetical protein HU200_048638 [Digitaria exilis]|uniref:DC1 domain-containing protein n=1 Tax=Digitaria exilis TaxID=1010633 RepID=A0A835EBW1_9POAL|nr:hypothetical protein HU200_048638 [Digitaria exilis]